MKLHYVNGIYDENGKEIIRPLNEEEKEFLNKFNNEYEHNYFDSEFNLHDALVEVNIEKIEELRRKKKELTKSLKELRRGELSSVEFSNLKKSLILQKNEVIEELKNIDIKRELYNKNYASRSDLMNWKGTCLITDLNYKTFKGISCPENSSEHELFDSLKSKET